MDNERELAAAFCRGFLRWYDFFHEGDILFVGRPEHPFADGFTDNSPDIRFASVDEIMNEEWLVEHRNGFRYIISIEDLERQANQADLLNAWRELLSENGCLLLGLNNRFGVRYFCGDVDPYTHSSFDGIENYQHIYAEPDCEYQGRMYSQAELRRMLRTAGWEHMKFFSVLPDLWNPYFLCAEDYYPQEDLEGRIVPVYNRPDTVFLEEETLYWSLLENGMFHTMANAYLVECPLDGRFSDVRQVTISFERSPENVLMTVLHEKTVEKRALYKEGKKRLQQMDENIKDLAVHSLKVVPGKLEDDRYIMPYIEAETGQVYLKRLYRQDRELFIQALGKFRDCVMKSADILIPDKGDGRGLIFRRGYLDLIPLNSFYIDGEFVFFDQEFVKDEYPAYAVLIRTVFSFYSQHPELYKDFPISEMISYLGLDQYLDEWTRYDAEFIGSLLQKEKLVDYYSSRRRNPVMVSMNRRIVGGGAEEIQKAIVAQIIHGKTLSFPPLTKLLRIYQQVYMYQFFHYDKRKLVLFGSGKYAVRFLDMYRSDYSVAAIVDNQESRWGTRGDDVEVVSPDILRGAGKEEYKVLICIRDSDAVERQLESYGIFDYYVFNPGSPYPRKVGQNTTERAEKNTAQSTNKKYHVGYIAGVFDLFHIGHLNMFRRAKEQCDYLIVGIVTDRGVREGKKVEPFVPFEERLEMVRSCRYVDEAHAIPYEHPDTDMAWQMYHFDVQFSGSDYEHDPVWLNKKKWLEERGSTMVFFSYTQSTSSTKLKKLIAERLI